MTATIRKELKRRSAVEPIIGHMKEDGKLGRNWLKGSLGDKINALLCGAGHNIKDYPQKTGGVAFFFYSYLFYRRKSGEIYPSTRRNKLGHLSGKMAFFKIDYLAIDSELQVNKHSVLC